MAHTPNRLSHPTLLFDGYCHLCNQSVMAVIKRDPQGVLRFASLQSAIGQSLLHQHGLNPADIDSVVLIQKDSYSVKGDAVLEVFRLRGGMYGVLGAFKIFPRSVRNWVYDWVAKNRYVWFEKKEVCMMPTPELEDRFLT